MRKRYLIASATQLKYLTLIVISMTVPTVIVAGSLYFIIFRIVEENISQPEIIVRNLLPAINKVNLIVAIGLPVVFLCLFVWGLLLSHRFAGPIKRLMRELNQIAAERNFGRRLTVRRNDDLKPLVECMNRILESAEQKT